MTIELSLDKLHGKIQRHGLQAKGGPMKFRELNIATLRTLGAVVFGFLFVVAFNRPLEAQTSKLPITAASYSEAYCSGFIAEADLTHAGQILGAEEGLKKNALATGDLIYMGNGPVSNFQKGQEVFIVRPVRNLRNYGTIYADMGHVLIVDVNENVVVGRISFTCEPLTVGDWVVIPQSRLLPPAASRSVLDVFARPSGKAGGRIIASKDRIVQLGQGVIAYLNLGLDQGVQPGATLRIFRPSNEGSVNEYNKEYLKKVVRKMNFPRQIIGECVVLQTGKGTATAIITLSLEEIYLGDFVEVE